MKNVIATPDAPAAVGPYSQAIAIGDLLFCAGQIPLDPASGNLIEGDITAQTTRVLDNVKAVLAANSMSFADVVKATVFLADMNDFTAMNAVYAKYFQAPYPARSTIQVARLPKDARVEIEVIAARS
jgi:2-iminobutanoate/2-iminopropanoate deaminase